LSEADKLHATQLSALNNELKAARAEIEELRLESGA